MNGGAAVRLRFEYDAWGACISRATGCVPLGMPASRKATAERAMFSRGENARSSHRTRVRAGTELPKGKGGRPRLPEASRRRHQLTVSLNDDELATVTEKAARAGLRTSVYLREAGLEARLSTKVNDAAYHAFSRIGNNVNQLAHIANATGELADEVRLRAVLAEVLSLRSLL